MLAATAALSDSTPPAIGMLNRQSQVSPTSLPNPEPSAPTTMTTLPVHTSSGSPSKVTSPSEARPTTENPAF